MLTITEILSKSKEHMQFLICFMKSFSFITLKNKIDNCVLGAPVLINGYCSYLICSMHKIRHLCNWDNTVCSVCLNWLNYVKTLCNPCRILCVHLMWKEKKTIQKKSNWDITADKNQEYPTGHFLNSVSFYCIWPEMNSRLL